ncbi:pyridoxal-phosphate dependent enzyme [Roseateles sp. DAIF2]|uniref:threonine ammonia-lyase n=1 Tax=Roseateles sp. DAIF2 TaxID=2714952 RepID=UPI0018A32223|nr:pyridoxal-phosphate dependent enzyme [Roseateles sp. DAIF2]QPF74108.1 pyridoxal-phosphate dependent enzyme [Roseateles sp. DAIF2]
MSSDLPDFEAVRQARERIRADLVLTPLLRNAQLDAALGAEVWIKPESLQRTGSFKVRGAFSRLRLLSAEQRRAGVVTASSGSHALAVAEAARELGIKATVLMPANAPRPKLEGVRRAGAELLLAPPDEDRAARARALAAERGALFVPPVDDPAVIAGQGTATLEALEQLQPVWPEGPDLLLLPLGGGGLAAGASLVLAALSPRTRLVGVEPAGHDDYGRSLRAGERLRNERGQRSFCDALLAGAPGELSFPINLRHELQAVTVDDVEVAEALRFALRELKLVLEPGGAVALAAALAGKLPLQGRRVLLLLSGGNIDPATLQAVLAAEAAP